VQEKAKPVRPPTRAQPTPRQTSKQTNGRGDGSFAAHPTHTPRRSVPGADRQPCAKRRAFSVSVSAGSKFSRQPYVYWHSASPAAVRARMRHRDRPAHAAMSRAAVSAGAMPDTPHGVVCTAARRCRTEDPAPADCRASLGSDGRGSPASAHARLHSWPRCSHVAESLYHRIHDHRSPATFVFNVALRCCTPTRCVACRSRLLH
jgi:hypothetical protein